MSGCNSQAADSANAGAESAVSAAAATSVLIENRVMSSNPPQPMMFARPAQPVETNHERCQPVNTMRQRGANANDFVIFSLTLHDYLSSAIDCRKRFGDDSDEAFNENRFWYCVVSSALRCGARRRLQTL